MKPRVPATSAITTTRKKKEHKARRKSSGNFTIFVALILIWLALTLLSTNTTWGSNVEPIVMDLYQSQKLWFQRPGYLLTETEMSDLHLPLNRSLRFPSAQERVQIYMHYWYLPPCDNSTVVKWRFVNASLRSRGIVLTKKTGTETIWNITVRNDNIHQSRHGPVVLWATRDKMEYCLSHEPKYRKVYCHDLLRYINPHGMQWLEQNHPSSPIELPPLLTRFGDSMRQFRAPFLGKFRKALSPLKLQEIIQHSTTPQNSCSRLDDPRGYMPILWRLTVARHFAPCNNVAAVDSLWENKLDRAVWRGALTGPRPDRSKSDLENCLTMERCRLAYLVAKHDNPNRSLVDAKLTTANDRLKNMTDMGDILGQTKSMGDILTYKIVISLQGNDLSSGLKWMLLSRSVVLMPPPGLASWALEDQLRPWVHYVPLEVYPLSWPDIYSKVTWILEHDEQAQRIAAAGSQWIQDLL